VVVVRLLHYLIGHVALKDFIGQIPPMLTTQRTLQAIQDEGSVSTGAGIFFRRPLQQITKACWFVGPWNMQTL
jgi:hypothetical protein